MGRGGGGGGGLGGGCHNLFFSIFISEPLKVVEKLGNCKTGDDIGYISFSGYVFARVIVACIIIVDMLVGVIVGCSFMFHLSLLNLMWRLIDLPSNGMLIILPGKQ